MKDIFLVIIASVVLVALACLIVGLPVFLIQRFIHSKRTRGMSPEERIAYLGKQKKFPNFGPIDPKSDVLGVVPSPPVSRRNRQKAFGSVIAVFVLAILVWYFYGGGIQDSVANEALEQYDIAKRSGTAMDRCVHAGIVRAAYLQAHDEDNYKKWLSIERTDCSLAGIPETP
jgi:hypothetical protein